MRRLARELRAAGHFTVAALTRPFAFEGARKLEAADKLIAELEQIAHLARPPPPPAVEQPRPAFMMPAVGGDFLSAKAAQGCRRCCRNFTMWKCRFKAFWLEGNPK